MDRRAFLYSTPLFPVAVAAIDTDVLYNEKSPPSLPLMYYVWVFSNTETDFIPIGAFSNKEQADMCLENAREEYRRDPRINDKDARLVGAVLYETFAEFTSRAVSIRLGALNDSLQELLGKSKLAPNEYVNWG